MATRPMAAISRTCRGSAADVPDRIPLNDLRRHLAPFTAELKSVISAVIDEGNFILGQQCAAFEQAFASYCGTSECIGTANGTDALEIALRAVGVGSGSRVAMVANAGGYAAQAALAIGAIPVFVDIVAETMTLSPQSLAACERFDAVVATHLYGRMADMPAILAAAPNVPVVEDCAQAHGASLGDRKAGAWGTAAAFSFYPTKNLGALGDAGAITTNDADVARRARELRQYGWGEKYVAKRSGGRNSRLDELQAAVLLALLPHLDRWNKQRQSVADRYARWLEGCPLDLPVIRADQSHVAHLYVLRARNRAAIMPILERMGVATGIHYPVLDYRQAPIAQRLDAIQPLPESESAVAEIFTIPCFPELSDSEIQTVATTLRQAAEAV